MVVHLSLIRMSIEQVPEQNGALVGSSSTTSLSSAGRGLAASDGGYPLLVHSLTHEHTSTYYDRHQLLLEKWCRDYHDGWAILYSCPLDAN